MQEAAISTTHVERSPHVGPAARAAVRSDWREELPVLMGSLVFLREPQPNDAPALLSMLSTEEVSRFMSPAPSSIGGYERFIAWAHLERAAGRCVCFAVVPHGTESPIGIFQVRALDPAFGSAEWGFALGSPFWGSGVFVDAAALVVDFAVDVLGAHRLEARAAVANGRGNGALRKLGAVREGMLRRSLRRDSTYLDQTLWTILDEDWRLSKASLTSPVH